MFSYRMNNVVPIIYLEVIIVFVQSTKNDWDDQCEVTTIRILSQYWDYFSLHQNYLLCY